MKNMLLLIICLYGLSSQAQTIIKKTVTIAKIRGGEKPVELDRAIIDGDTVYYFVFQNQQFHELTDIKSMSLHKTGLEEIVKGLTAAKAVNAGDNVMMSNFSISKGKNFGRTVYEFHYDGGYCNMSEKEALKLVEAIGKEL